MQRSKRISNVSTAAVACSALLAAGCASVPRGAALRLADAGISTTGAFGTDVRSRSTALDYVAVSDAFTTTYRTCLNPRLVCEAPLDGLQSDTSRRELARAIRLRAQALQALGSAYAALKAEAEYDARGDLVGATNSAIVGVNAFAASVAALTPAAPGVDLISTPLAQIAGFGAGLLADRNQRRRIVRGSKEIALATRHLRDALAVEAFNFELESDRLVMTAVRTRIALLEAGVASNAEALSPLTNHVGLRPSANAEAVIAHSPATRTAIEAMLRAQARGEVDAMNARYQTSLAALNGLLRAHQSLEADQGVDLADVDRFLGELNASLSSTTKE